MNLNAIAKHAYGTAKLNGRYTGHADRADIARYLLAVHGEVSEAYEDLRREDLDPARYTRQYDGKFVGMPIEIADVVILCAALSQHIGFDLEQAVAAKMTFNATRGVPHGRTAV